MNTGIKVYLSMLALSGTLAIGGCIIERKPEHTYIESHRAILAAWLKSTDLSIAGRCLQLEVELNRPITVREIEQIYDELEAKRKAAELGTTRSN